MEPNPASRPRPRRLSALPEQWTRARKRSSAPGSPSSKQQYDWRSTLRLPALGRRGSSGPVPPKNRGTVDRPRYLRMVAWRALYRGSEACVSVLLLCTIFLMVGRWTGWWPSPFKLAVECIEPVPFLLFAFFGFRRNARVAWDARRAAQPRLRMALDQLDALGHTEFELAVRDLMRRDGLAAEQVGGTNDDAVDVRAEDLDGRIWIVQCKHRRDGRDAATTGVRVIRELKGTASDIHRATFALVVTNGRFSSSAVATAKILGVHLVDGIKLGEWASGDRPLWEFLDRVPAPLRHPADWWSN